MKISIREAAKSIGALSIVAAVDPTGVALSVTALQQIWSLFVDHKSTKKGEAEDFLKGIEKHLESIDYNSLSDNEAKELLEALRNILSTSTFTYYDLAISKENTRTAASSIIDRSEHHLRPLSKDQWERCGQFITRYLVDAKDARKFIKSEAHAFQNELGTKLRDLEDKYSNLKNWVDLVTSPRLLAETQRPLPRTITPTVFLTAEWGLIPFYGRETEIEAFEDWCGKPKGLALQVLHAAGGYGKTRLMLEVCKKIRQSDEGWRAGFLIEYEFLNHPTGISVLCKNDKRLFIVIDYAETKSELICKLIGELNHVKSEDHEIRIVLIARTKGNWLDDLKTKSEFRSTFGDWAPVTTTSLAPITHHPDERETLAKSVQKEYSGLFPTSAIPSPLPDLSNPTFERILYIHLAAIASAEGQTISDSTKLLDMILDRETDLWWQHERIKSENLKIAKLQPIAAILTLHQSTSQQKLEILSLSLIPCEKDLARKIAETFFDFYQTDNETVGGITPDLIGERLICRVLDNQKSSAILETALSDDFTNEQWAHAFQVMFRIMISYDQYRPYIVEAIIGMKTERLLAILTPIAQNLLPGLLMNILRLL